MKPEFKFILSTGSSKMKINRPVIRRFSDVSFYHLVCELYKQHLVTEKAVHDLITCFCHIPKSILDKRRVECFQKYDALMDKFVDEELDHIPDNDLINCIWTVVKTHGIGDSSNVFGIGSSLFHELFEGSESSISWINKSEENQ